jgi:hypothetical protein
LAVAVVLVIPSVVTQAPVAVEQVVRQHTAAAAAAADFQVVVLEQLQDLEQLCQEHWD